MVETDKAIVDGLERNVKNLQTEHRNYSEQLKNLTRVNELIENEVSLNNEWVDMICKDGGLKRLDPKLAFENSEEHLELQRRMEYHSVEKKNNELLLQKQRNDRTIENCTTEIVRIEKELPRAEKKLSEARGE